MHPVDSAFMIFPGDLLHGVLPSHQPASSITSSSSRSSHQPPITPSSVSSSAPVPPSLSSPPAKRHKVKKEHARCASIDQPVEQKQQDRVEARPIQRLTLMIAWWNRTDFAKRKTPQANEKNDYPPQCPVPRVTPSCTWPNDLIRRGQAEMPVDTAQAAQQQPLSVQCVEPVWQPVPRSTAQTSSELDLPCGLDQRFFIQSPEQVYDDLLHQHWKGEVKVEHNPPE